MLWRVVAAVACAAVALAWREDRLTDVLDVDDGGEFGDFPAAVATWTSGRMMAANASGGDSSLLEEQVEIVSQGIDLVNELCKVNDNTMLIPREMKPWPKDCKDLCELRQEVTRITEEMERLHKESTRLGAESQAMMQKKSSKQWPWDCADKPVRFKASSSGKRCVAWDIVEPEGYKCAQFQNYVKEAKFLGRVDGVETLQACADLCSEKEGCKVIVHNVFKQCYLKSNTNSILLEDGPREKAYGTVSCERAKGWTFPEDPRPPNVIEVSGGHGSGAACNGKWYLAGKENGKHWYQRTRYGWFDGRRDRIVWVNDDMKYAREPRNLIEKLMQSGSMAGWMFFCGGKPHQNRAMYRLRHSPRNFRSLLTSTRSWNDGTSFHLDRKSPVTHLRIREIPPAQFHGAGMSLMSCQAQCLELDTCRAVHGDFGESGDAGACWTLHGDCSEEDTDPPRQKIWYKLDAGCTPGEEREQKRVETFLKDAPSKIEHNVEAMEMLDRKLHRIEHNIKHNTCKQVLDAFSKMLNDLFELIDKYLCQMASQLLALVASGADVVLSKLLTVVNPAAGVALTAYQSQPFCTMKWFNNADELGQIIKYSRPLPVGMSPKAAAVQLAQGVIWIVNELVCFLRKQKMVRRLMEPLFFGPARGMFESFNDELCSGLKLVGPWANALVAAGAEIMCANIISAVTALVNPIVMCSMYLGPTGNDGRRKRCQEKGCLW